MLLLSFEHLYNSTSITWDTLLLLVIGSLITGFIGGRTYLFQKYLENKTNRYHYSSILIEEVDHILDIPQRHDPILKHISNDTLPETKIYDGLTSSGNIIHINSKLRKNLSIFYRAFCRDVLEINLELGTQIRKDLSEIMRKNDDGLLDAFWQFMRFHDLQQFKKLKT